MSVWTRCYRCNDLIHIKDKNENDVPVPCVCLPCLVKNQEDEIIKLKNELRDERSLIDSLDGMYDYYERMWCGKEPPYCCNGRDCACAGKPTDPDYYIYQLTSEARKIKNLRRIILK